MSLCENSNKGVFGVIEIRDSRFYSHCPVCEREIEVEHYQRKNSEFTQRTGFADMVPYYREHVDWRQHDSEYDTLSV